MTARSSASTPGRPATSCAHASATTADLGAVAARDGIRLCLALAAVTFLVLVPLDYTWFSVLGWLR